MQVYCPRLNCISFFQSSNFLILPISLLNCCNHCRALPPPPPSIHCVPQIQSFWFSLCWLWLPSQSLDEEREIHIEISQRVFYWVHFPCKLQTEEICRGKVAISRRRRRRKSNWCATATGFELVICSRLMGLWPFRSSNGRSAAGEEKRRGDETAVHYGL